MSYFKIFVLTLFTGLCISDSKVAPQEPSEIVRPLADLGVWHQCSNVNSSGKESGTGNLALNAVAVQSSLGSPQGEAKRAVDGNTDSDFKKNSCTMTKAEFNPWWRVDLGNIYSVRNVTITNRGDCCEVRLRGAQIRVGNSLDNNGNNNELVATILTAFNGTQTFSFDPVNGRYVNIVLRGNNEILTLCEVTVFAG